MGKLTPGLSVEARANRESRMLRQVACPVRGSAVGKPTRRKAGQAPHLDSISVTPGYAYDSTAGYFTSLFR